MPDMPLPSTARLPDALPSAPYTVLIGAEEIAAFEAALHRADPAQLAITRLRNPLATPLSPQRAMMQLAPDDGGEDGDGGAEDGAEDGAGRLVRAMATRAAGCPALLVVVEQAETLTPTALALLQLLPGLRAPDGPTVRVAFQGTPAFRTLLRHPRFQAIRAHMDDDAVPDEAAPPAASPPEPPSRPAVRRGRLALAGTVLVAAMLGAGALLRGEAPDTPAPAAPPSAAPVITAPPPAAPPPMDAEAPTPTPGTVAAEAPAVPAPIPSPPAEADPAAARAVLFREFNAFVESRGLAGRLSRAERESLFQEYLIRRNAATAPAPATAAPDTAPAAAGTVEVVIYYPDTQPGAEAQAEEAAALLRQQMPEVLLRPAPQDRMPYPALPTLRYFRPVDQEPATALALALPPPAGAAAWQIVDLSAAADRPARPTIEVWLAPVPPAAGR